MLDLLSPNEIGELHSSMLKSENPTDTEFSMNSMFCIIIPVLNPYSHLSARDDIPRGPSDQTNPTPFP